VTRLAAAASRARSPRSPPPTTSAADRAAGLGLAGPIVEYQLQCATNRSPALTIYVAGGHALTCWSGVCYHARAVTLRIEVRFAPRAVRSVPHRPGPGDRRGRLPA